MQLNQPVQNPAFISKLKQFDSNKTRKDELELIEEMRKMRYITPVTLTGKIRRWNAQPADPGQVPGRDYQRARAFCYVL